MEWGGGNSSTIFMAEYKILFGDEGIKQAFAHPLVLLPFIGQLLLLISLFTKQTSKKLIYTSIVLLGLLVIMIFLAAILRMNIKMVLSCLPFFVFSFFLFRNR